jgi:NhaP-type Na+/H+ or K+/H+ antiporter
MAWDHLDLSKPHLVYIVLGGFTSIFMLCSSIIKERFYIGEATVATLVGIIFGPHAADVIDPSTWGNVDQITLEFSRIVLVVQCFAVGVELPKMYMNKHWKSVTLLLIPVMGTGWLVTTMVIWWMFHSRLDFIGSLCVAACVTATDPVLASSVVGKGKFAKRVPKHLRDLLSAESGCNDGMAFPFIYLALYLLHYHSNGSEVTFHWIVYTILYECVFGCVYGVLVGYIARRAIRYAHEHDFIDRESFLVFYFVLALFCAGSGSILGVDDLLVGFACGVGFSNDGWFQEKTEESHVSNVIDLLINLAFFVYFGTIIPWEQYNNAALGTEAWKLVVCGLFVVFFRRIPIMLLLKPVIKDVKTWREALFAGHFGPIGVGAIFVAILARAELETGSTVPLSSGDIPQDNEFLPIIQLVWPITTFLVIVSIVVHGSSVAVFTLGRHINTLTLTFSFTNVEEGPSWMDRLPRMSASRSRTSMSRADSDVDTLNEKPITPGQVPKNFLQRKKEKKRSKSWDSGIGPGGPVSQSAIMPASRNRTQESASSPQGSASGTQSPEDNESPGTLTPKEEIYREGDNVIIEDGDGNVKEIIKAPRRTEAEDEKIVSEEIRKVKKRDGHAPKQTTPTAPPERPGSSTWWKTRMDSFTTKSTPAEASTAPMTRSGPARAYTFGNTVIVEDEDGEVIKQYQLPTTRQPIGPAPDGATRTMLSRMGHMVRRPSIIASGAEPESVKPPNETNEEPEEEEEDQIRFTISHGGPRLKKEEFINALSKIDSRSRARVAHHLSEAEEAMRNSSISSLDPARQSSTSAPAKSGPSRIDEEEATASDSDHEPLQDVETIPGHPVQETLAQAAFSRGKETAAQARRRQFERKPSASSTKVASTAIPSASASGARRPSDARERRNSQGGEPGRSGSFLESEETDAERRRRLGALGIQPVEGADSDESDDDGSGFRDPSKKPKKKGGVAARRSRAPAASNSVAQAVETIKEEGTPSGTVSPRSPATPGTLRLRWSEDVGKKP